MPAQLLKPQLYFQNINPGIQIELMREAQEEDDDRNQEIFEGFIDAIKQEELHPGLLKFEKSLFESIKEMLGDQKTKLKEYLRNEGEEEGNLSRKNFRYMIYEAEIEKIDYLLKMYLKIRIKKIQLYSFYLLKNQHEAEKSLSPSELKFLRKYTEMRYQHYQDNIFKHFVKNYRDFKGMEVLLAKGEEVPKERKLFIETKQSQIDLREPNYNEYVFAMILTNPNQLRFGIDIPITNSKNEQQMEVISQGTIIFAPYRIIHDRMPPKDYKLI